MEQTGHVKWWHRVLAFLLGYVTAGISYELFKILLAYPAGRLCATTGDFCSFPLLQGIAAVLALATWIIVYVNCVRSWSKPK